MKIVFRLLYYSETSLYRHPLNTDTLLLQTVFLVPSPYFDFYINVLSGLKPT